MDLIEAIGFYNNKFGGFPYYLFAGAPEEEIIKAIQKALETGKEIVAPDDADY